MNREMRTGRFARPSRRNGRGLGIRYSMVARKREKAPRRAVISRFFK
jgi:hypothetical protein